ncbi:hypothetical protein GGR57DRAFT_502697 [Xylariaceae sp. FL1272]|nr:hypothetical protein GGR57DRAFT_502697 [Xylariaceae sp. FL1272]
MVSKLTPNVALLASTYVMIAPTMEGGVAILDHRTMEPTFSVQILMPSRSPQSGREVLM